MLKYIEVTGKNEDEALAKALAQLGMKRDDVSVEVLDRAKIGFLGIGSVPARIKVSYDAPSEESQISPPPESNPPSPSLNEGEEQIKVSPDVSPQPCNDEIAEKIVSYLTGLFVHMNINAFPVITRNEDTYHVALHGESLGALIGRRGETLDAIQQLVGYTINHSRTHRFRIYVDAENYRARREESLVRLAHKIAAKVIKYRRNMTLEAMNAYERHVIHAALQDFPGVTTYSTGNEPNRRIVVAYNSHQQ